MVFQLDKKIMIAKNDEQVMENIIKEYEPYILKCASQSLCRYITKNDDEWSIALMAFVEAVRNYEKEKGKFLSFANKVIQCRLIDYLRREKRNESEFLVSPDSFDGEIEEEDTDAGIKSNIINKIVSKEDSNLKMEILELNKVLERFRISFFDLEKSSPKAHKTMDLCIKVIQFIVNEKEICEKLRENGRLTNKILKNNIKLPLKFLEHHRKYIIAVVEIVSGDYPYLKEYVKMIKEVK